MQPSPPPNPHHVHGPHCQHSHSGHHASMQPHSIPRVFMVYACLSCQLLQGFCFQLPLMAQFYQIFMMMKMMVWNQPMDLYFQGINWITNKLPSIHLKRIFGGFAIPFFLVHFLSITYVMKIQIPDLASAYSIEFLLKASMFSSLILYVALLFMDPGYLTSKEDRAELQAIMRTRPEIANPRNLCQFCNQPKIARSFHCTFCESCITKWEKHNFIFNRCVGAGNQLIYFLFKISLTSLSFILLSATVMKKNTPHHHTLWGALIFFFILYNFLTNLQEAMLQSVSIFYNVTSFELMNCRRLNYLWKNKHGEFFNPFDKGPIHNVRESLESLMPQTQTQNPNDIEKCQETSALSADSVVNWRKIKFFTVMDIPNSPIRGILLEEMNKTNKMNGLNNGVVVINKKDNPFENPFQSNVQMKQKEPEETEKEALVSKIEEPNNPFTN